ncbi:MAG: hypothetical protein ACFCUO_05490 [Rhodospirillales bacterium]
MATLLVLGSKPNPALPPRSAYDDVACANASGRSARDRGLPTPAFTVMSSILTSGHQEANTLALRALAGLRTGTVYLYPRPRHRGNAIRKAWHDLKLIKTKPFYFERKLKSLEYRFDEFVAKPLEFYVDRVKALCDYDVEIADLIKRKLPSTGLIAIALGVGERGYERVIVSGFSFEITHAYAINPLIETQGTTGSKHAETDVAVLRYLSRKYGTVYTTETVVGERCGVPLLAA